MTPRSRSTTKQGKARKGAAKPTSQALPGSFPKSCAIEALVREEVLGQSVQTAGRLIAKRGHGGLVFADLRDASGKIQVCLKRDQVGPKNWAVFDTLTLGDILGVTGTLFKTKSREVTIQVEQVSLLAKALRPLPEKWHGLKDVEIRYRQRYLDLIANEPVRRVFAQRSRVVTSLRSTWSGTALSKSKPR